MAKVFVGQRKDPFVVNLGKTFDLENFDTVLILYLREVDSGGHGGFADAYASKFGRRVAKLQRIFM